MGLQLQSFTESDTEKRSEEQAMTTHITVLSKTEKDK